MIVALRFDVDLIFWITDIPPRAPVIPAVAPVLYREAIADSLLVEAIAPRLELEAFSPEIHAEALAPIIPVDF